MTCTSEEHYYGLPSINMVEGVGKHELGASSHFDPWQNTGYTQANLDLRKSHDAFSLGNLFGLVILWQPSCSHLLVSLLLCALWFGSHGIGHLFSSLLTLSLIVFFISRMWSLLFY